MFIPAITKQACRARDRAGDQDHLLIQTPLWAGQVSPPVAAISKDLSPRIEYARAMPCRSIRPKNQDPRYQVMMILIYPSHECHNPA